MKTNKVKDTHEEAKGLNSFPPSKSKKDLLTQYKDSNYIFFIMEVMREGTTTLEPVMDQMPLFLEMLNKKKKKSSGGNKCFLFVS